MLVIAQLDLKLSAQPPTIVEVDSHVTVEGREAWLEAEDPAKPRLCNHLTDGLVDFSGLVADNLNAKEVCKSLPGDTCWHLLVSHDLSDLLGNSHAVVRAANSNAWAKDLLHVVDEASHGFFAELDGETG